MSNYECNYQFDVFILHGKNTTKDYIRVTSLTERYLLNLIEGKTKSVSFVNGAYCSVIQPRSTTLQYKRYAITRLILSYNSSLYLALELEIVYNILNNNITALQTTHRPKICTECG